MNLKSIPELILVASICIVTTKDTLKPSVKEDHSENNIESDVRNNGIGISPYNILFNQFYNRYPQNENGSTFCRLACEV